MLCIVAPLTGWATTMAGWMSTCSRLDAICIAELALSFGLVGTFVMWK